MMKRKYCSSSTFYEEWTGFALLSSRGEGEQEDFLPCVRDNSRLNRLNCVQAHGDGKVEWVMKRARGAGDTIE